MQETLDISTEAITAALPPDFYAMHPSAQAAAWSRARAEVSLKMDPDTCPIHGPACEAWPKADEL